MAALVVMGVAGCGKSSVASSVASRLGWTLIEGDAFHTESNRGKMSQGVALTDAERTGWLDRLADELAAHPHATVLTCSALKRSYRERLRAASPGLCFAWLELSAAVALERVAGRGGAHFFPPSIVQNQFDTLEPPLGEPRVLRLDATLPLEQLSARVADWLA